VLDVVAPFAYTPTVAVALVPSVVADANALREFGIGRVPVAFREKDGLSIRRVPLAI
jgi:hypothetical protein